MADQHIGTVTLVFTDIEGSTRLLQQLGSADYATALADHHAIVRAALDQTGGSEIKTEGDSFFAIFGRASEAVDAVVKVQRQLAQHTWPAGTRVAVRMGVHTGEVGRVAGEYVGLDIHRAARISASAHGGQVVLSETTRDLVGDRLPDGVTLVDLGEHRLKDLDRPEHLFQLAIDGLRVDFPPLRSLATRFDLLPAEATTFVGRDTELAAARSLLGSTRLLTLTGPGGTGKTRLSLRLAREVSDTFADGAAFVQLAPISSPDLVATTIRQSLRFSEDKGRPAIETLVDRLSERDALLVLDNFEQVLPAATVVSTLLEGCERLKFIVTSRAALHVTGEQEYDVPPLAVPPPDDGADVARLAASEAVALFVERAKAVRPDFEFNDSNARTIVAICRRLDGLPLAIELAASRIKLLQPQALLARLEKSLDLLQVTAADRTDRQRTLRGAIDWSYRLLEDDLRSLFRRLGTFVGGWRLDDAEAVVAGGRQGVNVLDGIDRLIDHSLVRRAESPADEPRFTMLETIREFSLEQLAAEGELEATAAVHAARFAALAREAEPTLTGGPLWLDRFDADQANLRAALAWLAEDDVEQALVMGAALWRYWHRRGHLREGAATLERLLAQPDAQAPTLGRARALIGLAGVVYWQLNYAYAQRCYEEALAIAQSLSDDALQAEVLYSLVYVLALADDWAGAIRRNDEARSAYDRLGDQMGMSSSLMASAMIESLHGDRQRSIEMMDAAIATFRKTGNDFGLTNTLSMKERTLIQLDRNDEARAVNREFLVLARDTHDPTALSAALLDAASLEVLAGKAERAARLFGAGQRAIDEAGGEAPPELVRRIELLPMLQAELDRTTATLIAEGRQMTAAVAVDYALTGEPDQG